MKTIDIRLLVEDEADVEAIAEALKDVAVSDKPDRALWDIVGAVELVNDGFGRLSPSPQVRVRPNRRWSGQPLGA